MMKFNKIIQRCYSMLEHNSTLPMFTAILHLWAGEKELGP
jgi:hypothetical protein